MPIGKNIGFEHQLALGISCANVSIFVCAVQNCGVFINLNISRT